MLEKDQSEMIAKSDSRALSPGLTMGAETERVCLHSRTGVWDSSWVLDGVGLPWPGGSFVGAGWGLEFSSWKNNASQASCWHLDCLSLQGWNWLGMSH